MGLAYRLPKRILPLLRGRMQLSGGPENVATKRSTITCRKRGYEITTFQSSPSCTTKRTPDGSANGSIKYDPAYPSKQRPAIQINQSPFAVFIRLHTDHLTAAVSKFRAVGIASKKSRQSESATNPIDSNNRSATKFTASWDPFGFYWSRPSSMRGFGRRPSPSWDL